VNNIDVVERLSKRRAKRAHECCSGGSSVAENLRLT